MSTFHWALVVIAGFVVLVVGCELWLRHLDRRRERDNEQRRQALEFAAQPLKDRRHNGRRAR